MNLRDDWQWILTRAWSVRFIVIAAILSGMEVYVQVCLAFQIRAPFGIPAGVFAALASLTTAAAFIARFVAQRRDGAE